MRGCATSFWPCRPPPRRNLGHHAREEPHAVREHPDPQRPPAGAKGRDGAPRQAAVSELAQLPPEAVWVVFDEVAAEDWYVGSERVSELKKRMANK